VTAFRLLRLPIALTLVLVAIWIALPGRADQAFRVYLLVLAAYGLVQLLLGLHAALPRSGPSAFDLALRRRPVSPSPPEDAQSTSFDLHYRLRPTLRRLARELLRSRRGIDLDGDPEAARQALGDEAWEIVRADRPAPDDRFARGTDLATLGTVVSSLEAV
jgi:hypothetical protein